MALGWQPEDMIEQLRFWMLDEDWWDKCVELGSRAVPYLIISWT